MLGTPNRDRISVRREAVRAEILEAAWAVAREHGLAQLTLRDVAERVGMRPPSLYSHFASKLAIYDAMFGQAWATYEAHVEVSQASLPEHPRAAVKYAARDFFDFAVADPARHQLMNQRVVPGFEPSPESYAPAVRVLERGERTLHQLGVDDQQAFEIWVALIGGLINQQIANDPGGSRYAELLDRAMDMWADAVGLPAEPTTNRKRGRR